MAEDTTRVKLTEPADGRTATHLLVSRACDDDPHGSCAEVRVAFSEAPAQDTINEHREAAGVMFESTFGRLPDRLVTVVLPFVYTLDAEEDQC